MKEEVVPLRDQQFYRFSCQLFAEMKIPFQLLGWNENSISAGDFHFSWMARAPMHACARVSQPYPLGRRDSRVFVWYLCSELAGSSDHKFIFSLKCWSRKFISANRFISANFWNGVFISAQQLKWNFHFSKQLKWKLLNSTTRRDQHHSFKPFRSPSRE